MTKNTPTHQTMDQEKVKTSCKQRKWTPIKEIKKTPTRKRSNISTTQGKKMYTNILRGTKLGWVYFLCARPDTYEDMCHG